MLNVLNMLMHASLACWALLVLVSIQGHLVPEMVIWYLAFINIFPEFAQGKLVSPAWVTIIIYILRSREREIRFDSIRRKVCVRECVYAREKQRERGRQRQRKSPASIQLGAFDKLLTDRQKDRRVEEQKKCSQLGQISKICIHAREGRRVPPL